MELTGDPGLSEAWVDSGTPAGFWVRAGAALIDALVVLAAMSVVSVLATLAFQNTGTAVRVIQGAALVLGGLYFTLLTGFAGQTVGKMAAGIRVVTRQGGAVGYPRALGRWVAYSLSGLTLGLGFAFAGWNRDRRALHDFASGTRVVYRPGVGRGRKAAMGVLGVVFVVAAGFSAILTAANAPRQRELVERLRAEGEAVGNLKALRTVLAMHQGEKGRYPSTLEGLAGMADFTGLPELALPEHAPTKRAVTYEDPVGADGRVDPGRIGDSGGWGYVGDPDDPAYGAVFIDCTHTDSQGVAWDQY